MAFVVRSDMFDDVKAQMSRSYSEILEMKGGQELLDLANRLCF